MSKTPEQVNDRNVQKWCLESMNKLNIEMYILCLEPLTMLDPEMHM